MRKAHGRKDRASCWLVGSHGAYPEYSRLQEAYLRRGLVWSDLAASALGVWSQRAPPIPPHLHSCHAFTFIQTIITALRDLL